MATIFDAANWFLSKEPMRPKKVQKLCYYYKAWGLALYDRDLLPDYSFQAWIHGPVCPELYQKYRDYMWNEIPQYTEALFPFDEEETEVLESVWITYGDMPAGALENQTTMELPWKNARNGLELFKPCENLISIDDMKEYYKKVYSRYHGD